MEGSRAHPPPAPETQVRHAFTVDDVDRMVAAGVLRANGPWELIEGDIVLMAAQHAPHARMVAQLDRLLASRLPAGFESIPGVTVEMSPITRVDPDVVVLTSGFEGEIAPVSLVRLVVEVADATRRKDLSVKARIYAAAGVPEYWVVDLQAGATVVHRGPVAEGWTDISTAPFAAELRPLFDPSLALVLR